jgi:hypothetical protein
MAKEIGNTPLAQWHAQRWLAWHEVMNKITRSPHYRYEDPKKWPRLKLSKFAADMLAVHNDLAWKYSDEGK